MMMPDSWNEHIWNGQKMYSISNKIGCFECNDTGLLKRFHSELLNRLSDAPHGFHSCGSEERNIQNLLIPEGITSIGHSLWSAPIWNVQEATELLEKLIVIGKVRFPSTLVELGPCALQGSLLMDVELPPSLRRIGAGAFMCCYMNRLTIPVSLPWPKMAYSEPSERCLAIQGRQFKETIIDTLVIPEHYPYKTLMPEAIIHHVIYI